MFRASLLLAALAAWVALSRGIAAQTRDWKPVLDRLDAISTIPAGDWRFHPADGGHWEDPAADDSNWTPYKPGDTWTYGTAWFRRQVEIPASLGGYDPRGAVLRLQFTIPRDDEVRVGVFVNGTQVAEREGEERYVVPLIAHAEPGQKFLLAIRVQVLPGNTSLKDITLRLVPPPARPDPRRLVDECRAADTLLAAFPEEQAKRGAAVNAAIEAIDWVALASGDQAGFDASVRRAEQQLEPLDAWLEQFTIHATGNTHIDMAWLWPWTETVDVVRRTFTSALELMEERPDFTFTMSTAQAYAWMEEKYPDLFKQIQQRVREGRWEPVGGMWVEPDLNMPDGESIVRQLLVGTRYFRKELGVDVRIGWNPDSFGYSWQLPQIYKKSGMDFFVTQKMAWNDTTRFPYLLFWWQSPDGSRVLTYFPHDYVNSMGPLKMAHDLADFEQHVHYPVLMHLYGVGDHGGGPTREMLDQAREWQQPGTIFPKLELGTAGAYLDAVAKKAPELNLPTWDSELYFQYHRGVFTSQALQKKNNRRSETLLLEAEKFASLATQFGRHYPQREFNEAWKKVLFNQFHDLMAGSGIHPLYVDAARDHEQVRLAGNEILGGALAELGAHADTAGAGVPVVVFNPLSWKRTDVVETEVQFPRKVRKVEVLDPGGEPTLSEVIGQDDATHRVRVRFIAKDVPATGYAVFHVASVRKAHPPASPLSAHGTMLENEFVRVVIDPKTGCMNSLYDKPHAYEAIAAGSCGNLLETFVDKPKAWDAWNIDANFEDKKWDLTDAQEVELTEDSPVRAVIRVVKKFQSSTFTQEITMYPGVPRVDVRMTADWHERHILLKVAFPVAASSDSATFEIPYGTIRRPTTRRTPEENAQFEVPALRWADLSDAKGGLSLLNDSKYGYDAKGNVLRLSLLRGPIWPDPEADQGTHTFTYSLVPHALGWKEAGTMRRGYELNTPLLAETATPHAGPLPASLSFLTIAPANLIVTAMKKAEDDDSLILRFYEFAGEKTDARLHLPWPVVEASETNLMETAGKALEIRGADVFVPTGPYEIQTVRIRLSPEVGAAPKKD